MNYIILNKKTQKWEIPEGNIFFTTDRTVGRKPSVICKILGAKGFARPHQVHGKEVVIIDHPQQPEADAVLCNTPGLCVGVSTADCIPVLVYDREHNAAAAIHAGWRGTKQRIVTETMRKMTETYGTDPAKCEAVIGPGISMESFEVDDDVYYEFEEAGFDLTFTAHSMPTQESDYEKWHIDLKEINRQLLIDCGVKDFNIIMNLTDTFTDEQFFSARREQKPKGIRRILRKIMGAIIPQYEKKHPMKCGRIFSGFVLFEQQ